MSKNKRSTKWYRQNEKEVAEMFDMKPTVNSGAGWLEKEDFQNDYLLCQLKSTDAQSISIKKKDIDILEYNAMVSHKVPFFMVQFIESNECFVLCRPSDIPSLSQYLKEKKVEKKSKNLLTNETPCSMINTTKEIKQSQSAREKFRMEQAEESKRRKEQYKIGRKEKRDEIKVHHKDSVFFN